MGMFRAISAIHFAEFQIFAIYKFCILLHITCLPSKFDLRNAEIDPGSQGIQLRRPRSPRGMAGTRSPRCTSFSCFSLDRGALRRFFCVPDVGA